MVPNTATPMVEPIWRKNWLLLVAAPISRGLTEFWMARVKMGRAGPEADAEEDHPPGHLAAAWSCRR